MFYDIKNIYTKMSTLQKYSNFELSKHGYDIDAFRNIKLIKKLNLHIKLICIS